jgi:outer membrane protein TolC
MKSIKTYIIAMCLLTAMLTEAQSSTDSLTLSDIMKSVMSNYPSLKKAEKDLTAADAKISLTQTAYLPDVNLSGSFTRIGPVTSIPFGGKTFQLTPENMYNVGISVNQTIYDFGKTEHNVTLDKNNKDLVQISSEQMKQKLSTAVLANFYTISFLQKAIQIKDEQLKNLLDHLNFVQKKEATGSATKYDILTTKVRISNIENQKTDLLTALEIQNAQLNSLMGKKADTQSIVKADLVEKQILLSVDSLCNIAFNERVEMKMIRQKEAISKSRLDIIKFQNNPSIAAFANGGFKNGYFNSNLEDIGRLNYSIGIGFKMPLFDANRSKYQKIQANADLESNKDEMDLTKRTITNEVVEANAGVHSSLKKVKQSELMVHQAEQAYELANVSYTAGTITNLDLLDSYTALSDSKLGLFKTKIDYTVSLQRLKIALGEKLY